MLSSICDSLSTSQMQGPDFVEHQKLFVEFFYLCSGVVTGLTWEDIRTPFFSEVGCMQTRLASNADELVDGIPSSFLQFTGGQAMKFHLPAPSDGKPADSARRLLRSRFSVSSESVKNISVWDW